MQAIIKAFWDIALFRQGPDSLPDSQPLLLLAAVAYAVIDVVVILTLYPSAALAPLFAGRCWFHGGLVCGSACLVR